MEIFQALGSQGAIVVGFVSTAAEILVAFVFLRTFKIIRRREYARLKRSEAEHQRCRAEWDPIFTLRLVTRRWPRVLRPKNLEYKSHPSARNLGWLEGAEKNQANTRRTGIKASGNGKLG